MKTTVYDILDEVTGPSYDAMLDFCSARGVQCSLVVRDDDRERDGIVSFLHRARPYFDSVAARAEWPGTKLSGHTASVYRYNLSGSFVSLLKMSARGLFDWNAMKNVSSELPEDLAIYRSDGSVLLGSIAHECDAWLELTAEEYRAISSLPLRLGKRSLA